MRVGLDSLGTRINARFPLMVPGAGLEPARLAAGDFESPESTNFTTRAVFVKTRIIARFFAVFGPTHLRPAKVSCKGGAQTQSQRCRAVEPAQYISC